VIVLATLEGPDPAARLRLRPSRRGGGSPSEPGPAWLSRATVIDVATPLSTEQQATAWLQGAGEEHLADGIEVLNWALAAYRVAAADPALVPLDRRQAAAARVGFGAGEEVADGRWSEVRELQWRPPRRGRRRMLAPDARLAALLTGHDQALVGEELALRARADLDALRLRHGALQVLIALDAAIAELSAEPEAVALAQRLTELRGHRDPVAAAAQAALGGEIDAVARAAVEEALGRIEAAFRARAAARG
jgi:hypothetical protein